MNASRQFAEEKGEDGDWQPEVQVPVVTLDANSQCQLNWARRGHKRGVEIFQEPRDSRRSSRLYSRLYK